MAENSLAKISQGRVIPIDRRADRVARNKSREVVDEVRLMGLKIDGALALGAHIMAGLRDLDDERRSLAAGDQVLNQVLSETQIQTMRQVAALQAKLYSEWGL